MSDFTVSAFADEISIDVKEQIRVLKDNDIHHIEIRSLNGKNVSELTLEEARKYKKLFDREGIKVSSIGSPIGKIDIHDEFPPHLTLFKHVLEVATIFESPFVRMFSFFIDKDENPDNFAAEVLSRWQQFIEATKAYPEIILLHENEKGIYGDTAERCLHLIKEINSPQLRAAFDSANFVQCDIEVFPKAYQLLEEYIAYVHIKDAKYSNHQVQPAGLGDGKVEAVLRSLAEKGFSGFLSIEPHLSSFEGFAQLEKENVSGVNEKGDNIRLFYVAANALRDIIVNRMNEEWR